MKQFGRHAEVLFPGFSISSDKLTIEFDVPFDNDVEPNESGITIYNLSRDTINRIKKDQKITLNAGYRGDIGAILSGYVSFTETDHTSADKTTTINILDSRPLDGKKTVKKTYKKNIKASQIINDLLPSLGLTIGAVKLPNDKTYAGGYTVEGGITEELEKISLDCGASFYINKSKVYIRSIQIGDDTNFTLSAETGLIGTPEPFVDGRFNGYKVRCLLQHRITTASIINIESKYVNGKFRVRKGTHRWSGNDFISELEVI